MISFITAATYIKKAGILKKGLLVTGLISMAVLGTTLLKSQPASALSLPNHIVASSADFCDKKANGPLGFFGLEPWYHFMPDKELGYHGDACAIHCFNIFVQDNPNECGQTGSDIPGVVLAIIDDLLRIAALVAVAFIFIGSFQYVGSRGNAERTAAAQSTIISALTGLAIALVAVALVSYIGGQLH